MYSQPLFARIDIRNLSFSEGNFLQIPRSTEGILKIPEGILHEKNPELRTVWSIFPSNEFCQIFIHYGDLEEIPYNTSLSGDFISEIPLALSFQKSPRNRYFAWEKIFKGICII